MAFARLKVLTATAAIGFFAAQQALAVDMDTLEPYKMLRSLQFVQDSVVVGDHSATDMQRFMLGTIDKRLRDSDPSAFDEVRNVDAALIYAMSGGNPATLEYLTAHDINGNFDSRVSDALRKYLSGKGALIAKTLADIAVEYKNSRMGPYLALVAGNVTVTTEPAKALEFYDWARLTAPGTIIEEAALRRSLAVAVEANMVDKALGYSQRYARRFLHSPYASQFADLFVQLAADHYEELSESDILATLGFMDADRQREVYLRIARKAAIDGNTELAGLAAEKASSISGEANDNLAALAKLYGGVADISTAEVGDVIKSISAIPDSMLTPSDRALRSAAEMVAREVLRPPVPESLTQADGDRPLSSEEVVAEGEAPLQDPTLAAPQAVAAKAPDIEAPNVDPEFKTFVTKGRSKLDEIDSLLAEEGN
ncbi:chemotaxis protein MotC [Agrobacterium sp. ES01]|uniref:chemotaxis protein MotC n=1 Tax=Agrobacterium sp. ES01 TaxID=3420714 RepID=UPI003D1170C7